MDRLSALRSTLIVSPVAADTEEVIDKAPVGMRKVGQVRDHVLDQAGFLQSIGLGLPRHEVQPRPLH